MFFTFLFLSLGILTWISILGILLVLGAFWLSKCFVTTKSGTVTIIGKWGKEAIEVTNKGLDRICWPVKQVMDNISTERVTFNIPEFRLRCFYKTIPHGKVVNPDHNGVVDLKSGEFSAVYQVYFVDKNNTIMQKNLNGYYEVSKDGKLDHGKIQEMIKDSIQSKMKLSIKHLGFLEALAMQQKIIDDIKIAVNIEYQDNHLPIRILELDMNVPLEPNSPELAKAIRAKPLAKLAMATAEDERALDIYNAKQRVKIAELEGQAIIIKMKSIAKAYGFDKLPETAVATAHLTNKALEFYQAIAAGSNSKILLMPNVGDSMNEVIGMFKKLSQHGG